VAVEVEAGAHLTDVECARYGNLHAATRETWKGSNTNMGKNASACSSIGSYIDTNVVLI
jgi:hypothetical protein